MKLSLQPYKGSRDFYPEEMIIRNFMFSRMRKTVESFGYLEYDAPIIEEADLYRAKSGEEIINEQTYTFTDRGGREVTIRPEMTPTLARMIAQRRREITPPARWYSIPNLWRYERPQRGRLREHWQLNVDLLGADSIDADLEIILIANQIMKNFGAKSDTYVIKINNRKLLNDLFDIVFKLDQKEKYTTTKILDRKNKTTHENFTMELENTIGKDRSLTLIKLLTDVEKNGINALPETLKSSTGYTEINNILEKLKTLDCTNILFDITLMRGFDYYTGMIFEIFDTHPDNKRSLFGGGRYDELVGLFGVEPISAVGFGMGDVAFLDYLKTHALIPTNLKKPSLAICLITPDQSTSAQQLAQRLRTENITAMVNITHRKLQKQIEHAQKEGYSHIICIGDDEITNRKYRIKKLDTGEEKLVSENEIANIIKNNQ